MKSIKMREAVPFKADESYKVYQPRIDAKYAEIKAEFNVDLGSLVGVNYDTKTDRYVGKFARNERTYTVKLARDVAVFMLQNVKGDADGRIGSYYLKLDEKDGSISDGILVYL